MQGMLFKNIVYVKNNKHFMFLVRKFSGEGVEIVLIFYYVNLGNWNFLGKSPDHLTSPPTPTLKPRSVHVHCLYTIESNMFSIN